MRLNAANLEIERLKKLMQQLEVEQVKERERYVKQIDILSQRGQGYYIIF
jgi:septal ring factor EnvC (AmiA/AmiB activator)